MLLERLQQGLLTNFCKLSLDGRWAGLMLKAWSSSLNEPEQQADHEEKMVFSTSKLAVYSPSFPLFAAIH